ncbi:MAG: hypothetical protein AAF235_07250, partial [Planctomycetota bacterium]
MCAIEMASRLEDSADWSVYADPPYIEKGAKYVHDFEYGDHARLADALSRFERTKVVVSYYEHPELDRLYPGWHRVSCPMNKGLVNGSGSKQSDGTVMAPEVLLLNGPAAEAAGCGGLFEASRVKA